MGAGARAEDTASDGIDLLIACRNFAQNGTGMSNFAGLTTEWNA